MTFNLFAPLNNNSNYSARLHRLLLHEFPKMNPSCEEQKLLQSSGKESNIMEKALSTSLKSPIRFNINLMAVGDQVPRWIASQMGLTAADLAQRGSIAAVTGSTEQMCETLVQRRERLGFSYVLVSDEFMEPFAPVVERLAGH